MKVSNEYLKKNIARQELAGRMMGRNKNFLPGNHHEYFSTNLKRNSMTLFKIKKNPHFFCCIFLLSIYYFHYEHIPNTQMRSCESDKVERLQTTDCFLYGTPKKQTKTMKIKFIGKNLSYLFVNNRKSEKRKFFSIFAAMQRQINQKPRGKKKVLQTLVRSYRSPQA